jgi:hypothetical protein
MFADAATEAGWKPLVGRTTKNTIVLEGRVGFEFGDLRVETDDCHLIVEHEGAGGVTNLAKYWYCLQKNKILKPAHLFHIYHVAKGSDYQSHTDLWNFLWELMAPLARAKQFKAKMYRYSSREELNDVLAEFKALL